MNYPNIFGTSVLIALGIIIFPINNAFALLPISFTLIAEAVGR